MSTRTYAADMIAKCRNGHSIRGSYDTAGRNGGWLPCPCGSRGIAKGLEIVIKPETRCGAKCTSALGGVCNCSCGGERHGEDHRY